MANTTIPIELSSTPGIVDNSNATAITIDSSENVGIGTSNPASKLHVSNGSAGIQLAPDGISDGISFLQAYDWVANTYDGLRYYANEHYFYTGNNERMRIDSSGNVLVGATSNVTSQRLHIEQGGNLGQLGLRNSSATSGKFWYMGPNTSNHFILYNDAIAGLYVLDGNNSWTGASDESLKENIVELTGALDKVKDFRCVEYNFIADENKSKKIGFIAQDWQEDYSQVVSQDEDGNLGMQYTETIPVLLKAIQEQQTIIESLEARITALES